jgi:hypothetical protein
MVDILELTKRETFFNMAARSFFMTFPQSDAQLGWREGGRGGDSDAAVPGSRVLGAVKGITNAKYKNIFVHKTAFK